jgi:uncharacterized membrane protein (UPF0127 family)
MKAQRSKEARGREAKRIRDGFFFASCFLFFCFFHGGCSSRFVQPQDPVCFCGGCFPDLAEQQDQVCFPRKCFNVEVVQKEEELRRGLQFRKSLDRGSGMLFIFKESWPYAFWMKDTLIPLDMIWMDDTRKVVHVEHNVPPCTMDPCPSYPPKQAALYVLEINAGYAEKFGLQIGDIAEFRLNAF